MTEIIDILKGVREINSINDALCKISKNTDTDEDPRKRELLARRRTIEDSIGETFSLESLTRIVRMFHNVMYLPEGMEALDGTILPAGLIRRDHFRMIAGFDITQIVGPQESATYVMPVIDGTTEYVHIPHARAQDLIDSLMETKGKFVRRRNIEVPYEQSAARFDTKIRNVKIDNTHLFETLEKAIELYGVLEIIGQNEILVHRYNHLLSQLPEEGFSLDQALDYRNYLVGKFQGNPRLLREEFDFYSTESQMMSDITKDSRDPCNYCCLDDLLREVNNRWHMLHKITRDAFPQINETVIKEIQGESGFNHMLFGRPDDSPLKESEQSRPSEKRYLGYNQLLSRSQRQYSFAQLMGLRRHFIISHPSNETFDEKREYHFDDSEFYVRGMGKQLSLDLGDTK
jgi:hypothetical protein